MIDVAGILAAKDGRETFQLEAAARPDPIAHQGAIISFEQPVRLAVGLRRLDRIGDRPGTLLAHVQTSARARLACDRCLEPFDLPLELDYDEEFRAADRGGVTGDGADGAEDDDVEGGAGDIRRSTYSGEAIDLTDGFVEAVILALPIKRLCREECRGLCLRCGANLNQGDCGCREERVDPRLEPLRRLLSKKEPEEG